jgi:hypothetical protein
MLDADEMAELLIAAHGLDEGLSQACERFVALRNVGDYVGADTWFCIASSIWQVISAWTDAAEASGVMH